MVDSHPKQPSSRGCGPWAVVRRFHRAEGGQAMFVVLAFLLLLVGLLFLVLNSGQMLNRKVQMQNAADAVTASGAGWYSRGLNTISMCNVVETQLLSMINLLDTMETVTPAAVQCINDLVQNIGRAKAKKDFPIDPRLSTWLVVGNASSEQQIIRQFGDLVSAVSWPDYLQYDSGTLWQCAKLMDAFSHAMAIDTPVVVQREAIAIAKKNGADFGFVLPLWASLPVVDGHFSDFKPVMMYARMPAAFGGGRIEGFGAVMGYYGYGGRRMGPWSYWRDPFIATQPMGLFDISAFSEMFTLVSTMKLDMMFGGANDHVALTPTGTGATREMDYETAKGESGMVTRTWWEVSTFDARYEDQEEFPAFPPPQTGVWTAKHNPQKPIPTTIPNPLADPIQQNGWFDMAANGFRRATLTEQGADPREAVFYRVDRRRTPHYPELGIFAPHPPNHDDGTDWPYTDAEMHTYWAVTMCRFNGAELQPDQTLHRNYMPPIGVEPIAPIFLDMATGDNYTQNIESKFTFNGFAYRSGQVPDLSTRFINPNVTKDTIAFAQARVYNRYSHDLFTQHWRVKLMRTEASRWKPMIEAINDTNAITSLSALGVSITPDQTQSVQQMLQYYDETLVSEVAN